jgi:hypothetical protein
VKESAEESLQALLAALPKFVSAQRLRHVTLDFEDEFWMMSREFCSFINPSHRAQEGGGGRGGESGGGTTEEVWGEAEEVCGEAEEGRGEEEEVRGAVGLGRADGEGR